ncbi:hypothetical protein Cantr_03341 [Candida viswanathii]|uniref:LicD/FKTN/FKRP nucleotidyltransferase domain-containing protein n=1 Tax=Candida viswanathii TaxID=5486 RepID=A0A367YNE4_9ASCO|nr:hypothetical protein Cantr_03341 [Candida viswanathii]
MPRLNKLLSPRFLIKSILCISIFYTIFLSTTTLFRMPTIIQYRNSINQQLKHKFNQWYYTILESNHHLDTDKNFLTQMENIKNFKLQHSTNFELWDLDSNLTLPLEVEVPDYYKHNSYKPLIQPFDPRLTLSVYYKYIQENSHHNLQLPFHWSDWVDLSKLHKYIINPRKSNLCSSMFNISDKTDLIKDSDIFDINSYCQPKPDSLLGYNITGPTGPQTKQNRELLGKSYLYSSAPSPRKLIFLTNASSYQFDVQNSEVNNLNNSILYSDMMSEISYPSTLNVLESYQSLVKANPPPKNDESFKSHTLEIPEGLFDVNPEVIIKDLKAQGPHLNYMDEKFLESITFSHECKDPPKYFSEAKLLKKIKNDWMGEHYDWRFFNGITIGKDEQFIILHRLVKNYLNFARENGIITWIAHGSLLSWYWNGIAFPWDTDIDVQMPVSELYKLGRYFNQSLVVENVGDSYNEFDGMGRYFIDVGSSITHRTKGNGNNNIDARFIDVDTGLYIDITGLALTDHPAPSRYDNFIAMDPLKKKFIDMHSKPNEENNMLKNQQLKVYNCRNNHFSSYDELSPLVLTLVENQLSYIPSNFINILNDEYSLNSLTKKTHRSYTYMNNFRIWYKTDIIKDFLKKSKTWISDHAISKELENYEFLIRLNKLSINDHLALLQNVGLLKEWFKTMHFTNYHNLELKEMINRNFNKAKNLLDEYKKNHKLGIGMRPDYFINLIMLDTSRWSYSLQVNDLIELQKLYEKEEK